jgi:hypothetical protein
VKKPVPKVVKAATITKTLARPARARVGFTG